MKAYGLEKVGIAGSVVIGLALALTLVLTRMPPTGRVKHPGKENGEKGLSPAPCVNCEP
jgi:hypothetical protein